MLSERDYTNIESILYHCERINSNIANISLDEFINNLDIQDIILFNIFQIGEIAKKLSDEFINQYNTIPWKEIKGMRDRVGHGYQNLNIERTYLTAVNDIPALTKFCKELLKEGIN